MGRMKVVDGDGARGQMQSGSVGVVNGEQSSPPKPTSRVLAFVTWA